MCEAPSTWRARIWVIDPRFFNAAYKGLIAAPGTPKAQTTPSFSRTRTAASIARIFAISHPAQLFRPGDHQAERRAISTGVTLFPAVRHSAGFSTFAQVISGKKKWNRGARRK